jgi:hypothetical protein
MVGYVAVTAINTGADTDGRRYLGTCAWAGLGWTWRWCNGLRRGVRWWLEAASPYVLMVLEEGRQASPDDDDDLQPFAKHSPMPASEQGSQVPEPCSETSPIIVPNPRRPHYRTEPRGLTASNVCQARLFKAIAVPTSAVSRGQTSMTWWLSSPRTGIYQSAALCLCELLPAVPACAMNDAARSVAQ